MFPASSGDGYFVPKDFQHFARSKMLFVPRGQVIQQFYQLPRGFRSHVIKYVRSRVVLESEFVQFLFPGGSDPGSFHRSKISPERDLDLVTSPENLWSCGFGYPP